MQELTEKLEQVNRDLHTGTLNQNPLDFETTLKVIQAAQREEIQAANNPLEYALMRLLQNLSEEDQFTVSTVWPAELRNVAKLQNAIAENDWTDTIFQHKRFGQYAFQALKEQAITLEQFVTIFLRWEAEEQLTDSTRPLVRHQLFNEDSFSTNSEEILIPALWKMSSEELEIFKNELLATPSSEHNFWTVTIPESFYKKGRGRKKYGKALDQFQYRFRLFQLIEYRDCTEGKMLVVPSFSILKAYLKAVFRENAVDIVPAFGSGKLQQIEFDIPQNKRFFALHFPGIQGLEEGDGYYFGKYISSLHDFYHCHRISVIPFQHRLAYLRLSHVFKHCLELSRANPKKNLLTVYWSQQSPLGPPRVGKVYKYDAIKREDQKEFHKLYCEMTIDLESPACDGYIELFRNRNSRIYDLNWEEIPFPEIVKTVRFRPFNFINGLYLDGTQPERHLPQCIAIHDMVLNMEAWKEHFGIDGMQHHWTEAGSRNIQATLIQGYTNQTIDTPLEEFLRSEF